MIAITVFCPSVPRGGFAPYDFGRGVSLFEPGDGAAKILLNGFTDKFLMPVKLKSNVIQRPSASVLSVFRYRENLVIWFDCQVQFVLQIVFYRTKYAV